jgi:hypothetical protein
MAGPTKRKDGFHVGQLKLAMSEIQFLTGVKGPCYVVYAGSAPSNKIPILCELFPAVTWILIDPNTHHFMCGDGVKSPTTMYFVSAAGKPEELSSTMSRDVVKSGEVPANVAEIVAAGEYQVYIIEDYFTNDLATLLAPLPSLYFISDARTSDDDDFPSTLDILWNSAMAYNWIKILQPVRYMIKFRCPYGSITPASIKELVADYKRCPHTWPAFEYCDIKFIDNYCAGKFIFLAGDDIKLQAFAPKSSTETRLVGSELDVYEYDTLEYEEKLFYHNRTRATIARPHNYTSKDLGIDHCNDCALACSILQEYIVATGSEYTVIELFGHLLRSIQRNLHGHGHGRLIHHEPRKQQRGNARW